MAIDLRIYFVGLIIFSRKGEDGKDLHALLVDARRPGRLPGTEMVQPHLPVLLFDAASFDRGGTDPRVKLSPPLIDIAGKQKHYVLLNKDCLRLASNQETEEAELRFDFGREDGEEIPQTDTSARQLKWLAPLRNYYGEPARLKEGLLDLGGGVDAKKSLIGSVLMKAGAVAPAAFAAQRESFVTWDFHDEGKGARTIASVIEYSATLLSEADQPETARLELLKFDRTQPRTITFIPSDDDGRPFLELWVMNLETDIVLQKKRPGPVGSDHQNSEYLYFYDLIRDAAGYERIPVSIGHKYPGMIHPAFNPCMDLSMKSFYFPKGGGELALSAPCSPAYGRG